MDHVRHSYVGTISEHDAAAEGRAAAGTQARNAPGRNRSQQTLDDIFASDSFRELERQWAETAKRDAEKRRARPIERAPYRMIDMNARREFGTYRGKP